jgi:ankyrin repeat protein
VETDVGWDPQPDGRAAEEWDERSLFQIWWPVLAVVVGGFALVAVVFVLPISIFSRELSALDLWGDSTAPCEDPGAPLWFAAAEGDTAETRQLLDAGAAAPDMVDASLEGWTPLLCAADHRQTDVAVLLLAAGADPDLATGGRAAPIAIAAGDGNIELVQALLHAGADPDNDGNGTTALIQAVENGQADTAALLLEAGADPEKADESGRTPADITSPTPTATSSES